MKMYFFQCDKCRNWRYTSSTSTYCKCLRCGHSINIRNIKKVKYDIPRSKAPLVLKELKRLDAEKKTDNKKDCKEQYLTDKEMERYRHYFIEFCKEHSYVSSIKIAKRYREKYMPELYTQPILLHDVEKSLSIRVSKLIAEGCKDDYLANFTKKTYKVDHKKLKKHLKDLEND